MAPTTTKLLRFSALAAILFSASLAHGDDGGALRVLVRGDLDGTAVAAEIAAELGVATSLVDDESSCYAPCATVVAGDGGQAVIDMHGTSGYVLSRAIELPASPGAAAEVIALVVGNLARDEAGALIAGLSVGAGGASGGVSGGISVGVGPGASAPVIVPPSAPVRPAAVRPQPEVPRDPERRATFSFGLIPPLAFGVSGARGGGGVAVDLVVGGHRNLTAFSVAGVGSIVTDTVTGTQIGGAFAAAGKVEGAQIGGAVTVAGDVRGAQVAGAMAIASGNVDGVQIGGAAATTAGSVRGVQIGGAVSIAREVRGAQIAGSVAVSGGMVNTQLAGAVGTAAGDVDTQIAGAVAVSGGNVRGVQIAPFNVARRVEGVQVGVVNFAGGGDGISIGLLNIVRGGRTELEATVDDRNVGALVLRHGSRRWHNVYGVAARARQDLFDDEVADNDVWMYGLGFGPTWHSGKTTIDLEAMGWHVVYGDDFTDEVDMLAQARLVLGYPIGPASLVVGGAVNTYITTDEQRESAFSPRVLPGSTPPMTSGDDVRVEVWPSVFVGLRI